MSISLMAGVFDAGPEDPLQRLVLLSLADQAGFDGGVWLDMECTAARCAMSPEQVNAVLSELRVAGWLSGSALRPVISAIRMGVDEP